MLKRYFLWKTSLCGFTAFRKGIALCFVLKNIQNFVDLDACKQLFVLNSYKSAIKKPEVQKNHKSMIFLE